MKTPAVNSICDDQEPFKLDDLLRSQFFVQLVGLVQSIPALRPFLPELVQVNIVIDANPVQRELRWRLKYRQEEKNLSALHEVLVSGLAIAYAPYHLKAEIEEHFEDIAEDTGRHPRDVANEWAQFSKLIHFIHPTETALLASECHDRDDIAYLATWKQLHANAICTSDRHLAATEAPVFSVNIDTTLRAYARSSTVRLGVTCGTTVVGFASFEMLKTAGQLIRMLSRKFRSLSPGTQIVLVGALVVCLANTKTRERLAACWSMATRWLSKPGVMNLVGSLTNQWIQAGHTSDLSRKKISETIPLIPHLPLRRRLILVGAAANTSLNVAEFEQRLRLGGYTTKAKEPRSYIRRLLTTDSSFEEAKSGYWRFVGSALV